MSHQRWEKVEFLGPISSEFKTFFFFNFFKMNFIPKIVFFYFLIISLTKFYTNDMLYKCPHLPKKIIFRYLVFSMLPELQKKIELKILEAYQHHVLRFKFWLLRALPWKYFFRDYFAHVWWIYILFCPRAC